MNEEFEEALVEILNEHYGIEWQYKWDHDSSQLNLFLWIWHEKETGETDEN